MLRSLIVFGPVAAHLVYPDTSAWRTGNVFASTCIVLISCLVIEHIRVQHAL